MKHKIKFVDYQYVDDFGTHIELDGKLLFYDGQYTYNCLGEILTELGIEFEFEYIYETEKTMIERKKMKLVEE